MHPKLRVRLRLLLPILNAVIALALFRFGYQEAQRAHQEPLPALERARYVNYALNVPAWAAQSVTPWILHINEGVMYWKAMETEPDWWYLLYVILMWYYIGLRLDKYRTGDVTGEHKKQHLAGRSQASIPGLIRNLHLLSCVHDPLVFGTVVYRCGNRMGRRINNWQSLLIITSAVGWDIDGNTTDIGSCEVIPNGEKTWG